MTKSKLKKVVAKAAVVRGHHIYDGLTKTNAKKVERALMKHLRGTAFSKNVASYMSEIHQSALEKGWWKGGKRNVGELMALLHSEVSEAFEDYRDHGPNRLTKIRYAFGGPNDGKPEGFPIELADVFIRLMDTCAGLGIDLEHAVSVKMKYNSTRPYRHNGKFA